MSIKNPALSKLAVILSVCLCIGCKPAPDPMLDLMDTSLSSLKLDDLSRTTDFVFSETRFEQLQFEEKVASGLNRWINVESVNFKPGEWKLDSMGQGLIGEFESLPTVQRIGELSFVNTDAYYIQQAAWLKKLSRRLVANPQLQPFEIYRLAAGDYQAGPDVDDPLTEVMARLHEGLSPEDAAKLADGLKLFDWIVRNIQLEPDTQPKADEIEDLRLNKDAEGLAASGVKGTGYIRFPWQTLIYSRGDYVDRAKLFMLMADQLDIDSVMLTVKSETAGGQVQDRPWAVALSIGGQLYLFDTKLGLPIPGPKPGTIATLSEVKANPELLDSLDLRVDESLRDDTQYWVKEKDLASLKAKIYVTPESLSLRMWELENNLTGDRRLKLTNKPSELAARLPKIDGLQVELWDIAFQTHQFRAALREAIAKASYDDVIRQKINWHFRDESYVDEFTLYRTARSKYLNGLFETVRNDGNANAIELFYIMMYKDKTVDSLGTDKILQYKMGVLQDSNQSSADFEARIQGIQAQMRLVRRDAGYFLAQCHFDNSNFGTSINWLDRLRSKTDSVRWKDGVDYLKGRALEARREYDAAADVLSNDQSEQFHGNLIRARMLKQLGKSA